MNFNLNFCKNQYMQKQSHDCINFMYHAYAQASYYDCNIKARMNEDNCLHESNAKKIYQLSYEHKETIRGRKCNRRRKKVRVSVHILLVCLSLALFHLHTFVITILQPVTWLQNSQAIGDDESKLTIKHSSIC